MYSIDPAISSLLAAKQNAIETQAAFAVAAKSLSAQKQQGEALVQLIDAAAQIGKALGRGQLFDAVAQISEWRALERKLPESALHFVRR